MYIQKGVIKFAYLFSSTLERCVQLPDIHPHKLPETRQGLTILLKLFPGNEGTILWWSKMLPSIRFIVYQRVRGI